MESAKHRLERMIPLLNESPKAGRIMEAWPRKVQFEFDNQSSPFYITVVEGKMRLLEGACSDPDILVGGEEGALTAVLEGAIDVTHPIAHGRLVVKRGKISEMTHFNRILALAKRG